MNNIYLIRHGEAIDGWTSLDPKLSDKGKEQAKNLRPFIANKKLKNIKVISSPLLRCIETCEIALNKCNDVIKIDQNFSELPSPVKDLNSRVDWLKKVLPLTWKELENDKESKLSDIDYSKWKKNIINKVLSTKVETIIFTHFVVINCIVGSILGSNKVVNFYPNNCSITQIAIKNNKLEVIELGESQSTKVN
jgi:broad specificity phosphatase PhoE|tara:strand:- start:7526 stop:8104 length:579 start_codon:yes stop_codon:yes gene_type:complete